MQLRFGVFACVLFAELLQAADPTGRITGTVLDPASAPIAQARITARNDETGLTRQAVSAADGGFVFPLIPSGTYTVITEAPGFRRFERRHVLVAADANVNVAVSLQVGDVPESVTVEPHTELVHPRSGT